MNKPITADHPQQIKLEAALTMCGLQNEYDVRVCELRPGENRIVRIGMINKDSRRWVENVVPESLFDDLQNLAGYLQDRMVWLITNIVP